MAGALRRAALYLGIAEEDEAEAAYDDYDEPATRPAERGGRGAERAERAAEEERPRAERLDRGERDHRGAVGLAPVDDPVDADHRADVTPLPRRTPVAEVVRDVEVTGVHRITTIHPRSYDEAKSIGESFRDGTPVIMNLSALDDGEAKRLVDFAVGLVFGLQGTIERVTNRVFLLSPVNLEVTTSGGNARGRGLFGQG